MRHQRKLDDFIAVSGAAEIGPLGVALAADYINVAVAHCLRLGMIVDKRRGEGGARYQPQPGEHAA